MKLALLSVIAVLPGIMAAPYEGGFAVGYIDFDGAGTCQVPGADTTSQFRGALGPYKQKLGDEGDNKFSCPDKAYCKFVGSLLCSKYGKWTKAA